MSNTRESGRTRRARARHNAAASRRPSTIIVRRNDGDLSRGEGMRNYPYGPIRRHARKQNATVLAEAGRERRAYANHSRDAEKRTMLEAKTRDELRAICKAQNVTGYGKMNKSQLVEAALR